MQVELDLLQMSLLDVDVFRTPFSIVYMSHSAPPPSKNFTPKIQVYLGHSLFRRPVQRRRAVWQLAGFFWWGAEPLY
jgi:hypothetical protein